MAFTKDFIGDNIVMYHGRSEEVLKTLPDASVDIVMTDPPYKFLTRGVEWDGTNAFDEETVFFELKRVLKPNGFICLFGRGTSFYRWNCMLAGMGLRFLEEIIWHKRSISSPVNMVARVHETVSIHGFADSHIIKSRVAIQDDDEPDLNTLKVHVDRIIRFLDSGRNNKKLESLKNFLETGERVYDAKRKRKFEITIEGARNKMSDELLSLQFIVDGYVEKSVIQCSPKDRLKSVHPTQKPVDVLRRIMRLCRPENEGVVLDCFSGSGSTGMACIEDGRKYIGIEQDAAYYEASILRLKLNNGGKLL